MAPLTSACRVVFEPLHSSVLLACHVKGFRTGVLSRYISLCFNISDVRLRSSVTGFCSHFAHIATSTAFKRIPRLCKISLSCTRKDTILLTLLIYTLKEKIEVLSYL